MKTPGAIYKAYCDTCMEWFASGLHADFLSAAVLGHDASRHHTEIDVDKALANFRITEMPAFACTACGFTAVRESRDDVMREMVDHAYASHTNVAVELLARLLAGAE